MTLSAIVIAKDSAKKIDGCLSTLRFADEVIVVDAGSTDETISIAKRFGSKVVRSVDEGYAQKRNLGANTSKGEWLLYIDTDERVTEDLRQAIFKVIEGNDSRIRSYKIFRKNIILGKWLRHGGWWPDPVHRLIKKSALIRWEGRLHEHPVIRGGVGLITEPLVHESKHSLSEMVQNSNHFSKVEAELLFEAGHPPVRVYHFILAMWREFWSRGVVGLGFLDGIVGIIEIGFQMYHQTLIYSNLWQLQQQTVQIEGR